ncbi:MAG TPA: NAD(P)-dependent oxidoreductase [Pseudomonas sabulinigri]|uniref:6-phosphogluconate dehydrogenase NADP-binding domain-containing protein n=1 Tax=marine sediment metagenome TaxID=412755 RepID=A0A0F9UIC4_9ZZZZ|nr:NAD(P)-dependent oxidoreductase [Halopseudomonas sabulinigri]HEC52515.1 NAD(P)-dependent oxidoreductase [Halopseudomonas sabulinigri]|tara:strand:- start:2594 stop:3460 length:867 start_codon:yes stop_codon:yes gene_type:complete
MANIGFIGLGVMGYPMAGHLQRAGHNVTVYNRTASRARQWVAEHAGSAADTPALAAVDQDYVLLCVGNDDDLRAVIAGEDGVLQGARSGLVLVDHTTASADVARELAALAAEQGVGFLDAPVSGGQSGAEKGQLTIMVGGDESVFDLVRPIIKNYARMVQLMGPVGSGQLTKMVNQICIAGLVQGLSEALNFAQKAGLDAEAVVSVISKGAAQSWQMENRHKTMLAGDFEHGFAVDWMRKDLAIVLAEAQRNGAQLPVTALVDQFYADVQAMGGKRWDTSSLIARLKR